MYIQVLFTESQKIIENRELILIKLFLHRRYLRKDTKNLKCMPRNYCLFIG